MTLSETAWAEISRHAADAFPDECCGVVLERGGGEEVRRFNNIQNQLHALDPETYPREATTAYAMDPKELESTLDGAARAGAKIKAFYHSHPGHEAYFSAEDKAFAMPFGEPIFPDAAQIVVSIYDRAVKRIAAYAWVEMKKDFVEISLRKVSR
ncbi:MAG: Mov34/MPN/PAD-1 family protein [Candidatus Binatia bacterium]